MTDLFSAVRRDEVTEFCPSCRRKTVWAASYGRALYCKDKRHVRVDPLTIAFTQDEKAYKHWLAQRMEQAWRDDTRNDPKKTTFGIKSGRESWSFEVGASGELAMAKCFDFALPFEPGKWGDCDFGPLKGPGILVRTQLAQFYPAITVRPRDHANSIAVLAAILPDERVRLHAWCWVREAFAKVPLTNPPARVEHEDGTSRIEQLEDRPAHFVPMSSEITHLDVREIPFDKLGRIPRGYKPWANASRR